MGMFIADLDTSSQEAYNKSYAQAADNFLEVKITSILEKPSLRNGKPLSLKKIMKKGRFSKEDKGKIEYLLDQMVEDNYTLRGHSSYTLRTNSKGKYYFEYRL